MQFVTLRDHPRHNIPVLGGMWGGRGAPVPEMEQMICMFVCLSERAASGRRVAAYRYLHVLCLSRVVISAILGVEQ